MARRSGSKTNWILPVAVVGGVIALVALTSKKPAQAAGNSPGGAPGGVSLEGAFNVRGVGRGTPGVGAVVLQAAGTTGTKVDVLNVGWNGVLKNEGNMAIDLIFKNTLILAGVPFRSGGWTTPRRIEAGASTTVSAVALQVTAKDPPGNVIANVWVEDVAGNVFGRQTELVGVVEVLAPIVNLTGGFTLA